MYNMVKYLSIKNDKYNNMKNEFDSLINANNALVAIQDTMRCHDICREYIQMVIESYSPYDTRRINPMFIYPKVISIMCDDINKFKKNSSQEIVIDLLNASIDNHIKANNLLKERIKELETENQRLNSILDHITEDIKINRNKD